MHRSRWIVLCSLIGLLMLGAAASENVRAAPQQQAPCTGITISQIQGAGNSSPIKDKTKLRCVAGCVTGVTADGFFIQSITPDADPATSEGVFVYRYSTWKNPRELQPGDLLELHNFRVQEFYGQTEIVGLSDDTKRSYVRVGSCKLPAPAAIPAVSDPARDPHKDYERYEGMRVSMSFTATVVGPTERYVSRYPAGDPEITLVERASPAYGQRVFDPPLGPTDPLSPTVSLPEGIGTLALSGGLDVDLPEVGTLDRIAAEGVTGVLAYQFGRFVLLVDDSARLSTTDLPDPAWTPPPVQPGEFGVCSFNVLNLFDAMNDKDGDVGDWTPQDAKTYRASLEKRAAAIHDDLADCTVIALQEVEGKDEVWAALAEAAGPGYRYDYYESADSRDITVGILYRADRVELRRSASQQACTAQDYSVDYAAVRGPHGQANPCQPGSYPLFDRPPYMADLTVSNGDGTRRMDLRVIVNHFKSQSGDETENQPRRVAQAAFVASLMTAPHSVALGDFNDASGSETLAQFAGLTNVLDRYVGAGDRYTYIYNGRAEALDHFVMTPDLDSFFLMGRPVHINVDFPDPRAPDTSSRRSSDHDPLYVQFAFEPTGVTEALVGAVNGAIQRPHPRQ